MISYYYFNQQILPDKQLLVFFFKKKRNYYYYFYFLIRNEIDPKTKDFEGLTNCCQRGMVWLGRCLRIWKPNPSSTWHLENLKKRQRTIPHLFVSDSERERERTKTMASSKLQALWNHPAGPKTSESAQIFNPFISIHFLIFHLCFVFCVISMLRFFDSIG